MDSQETETNKTRAKQLINSNFSNPYLFLRTDNLLFYFHLCASVYADLKHVTVLFTHLFIHQNVLTAVTILGTTMDLSWQHVSRMLTEKTHNLIVAP